MHFPFTSLLLSILLLFTPLTLAKKDSRWNPDQPWNPTPLQALTDRLIFSVSLNAFITADRRDNTMKGLIWPMNGCHERKDKKMGLNCTCGQILV